MARPDYIQIKNTPERQELIAFIAAHLGYVAVDHRAAQDAIDYALRLTANYILPHLAGHPAADLPE